MRFFRVLGPGLVTGAADDDPSGISTYSVAGAATGYSMLWFTCSAILWRHRRRYRDRHRDGLAAHRRDQSAVLVGDAQRHRPGTPPGDHRLARIRPLGVTTGGMFYFMARGS